MCIYVSTTNSYLWYNIDSATTQNVGFYLDKDTATQTFLGNRTRYITRNHKLNHNAL